MDKSKPLDLNEIWPAECTCCDAVLHNRAEALRHSKLTGHEEVLAPVTDRDLEMIALEAICTRRTVLSDGAVLCDCGPVN